MRDIYNILQKAIKSGNEYDWIQYHHLTNRATTLISKSKTNHIGSLFIKVAGILKKFWKFQTELQS